MDDEINEGARAIITWGVAFILVLVIGGFIYYAVAPKWEDARRDAYEHSESYVQGAARDLSNLCIELDKADAAHRDLLQDTIRERYTKLDERDIPAYLRPCLRTAREN